MCHHTGGEQSQETADTTRKGLKRAKKEHFCTFYPLSCQSSRGCLRARSLGGSGNSQEFGGLWKFPRRRNSLSQLDPISQAWNQAPDTARVTAQPSIRLQNSGESSLSL